MTAYATRADVYAFGLPRGTLGLSSRLVESSLSSTDVFTLEDHGFSTDQELLFRATAGGSLPSPLVEGTIYYAIELSDSTFKVSATQGGAAINLTTSGENVLVGSELSVDRILNFYSRWVDQQLPATAVPLQPDGDGAYPELIVGWVAQLAARKLQQLAGHESASVKDLEIEIKAQLKDMAAKMLPLRDVNQTSANRSIVSTGATRNGSRDRGDDI